MGAFVVLILFTFPIWRKVFQGRSSGPYPQASDLQIEALSNIAKAADKGVAATVYVGMLTSVPAPTAEQATPSLPDAQSVRSGSFVGLDAVRVASGDVTLYRSTDGSLLLRFDKFSVTNGPQLRVYLSASDAPKVAADMDVGGFSKFPVAFLKGTKGNQQYTTIPKELNVARYKSVVIYSDALNLVYAYATFN